MSIFTDRQYRRKALYGFYKEIRWLLSRQCETIPIFVFGKQRSGTNMVMDIFRMHPDTKVLAESADNEVFLNFRIRSLETCRQSIERCRTPFLCFSPLMDSQHIQRFITFFPQGKFVWVYRHFLDNANSTIRHFPGDERKIDELVAQDRDPHWQWFYEGVSEATLTRLREVYHKGLSAFDKACLVWWVRNRIYLELDRSSARRVLLVQYEDLAGGAREIFQKICASLGMRFVETSVSHIHSKSIGKNPYPIVDADVYRLCVELKDYLDSYYESIITSV